MKILVVEDERKIADIVKRGLEISRHKVTAAYDGEQAFNIATKNSFDVILMDIMLPKMTGLEVTKKLRDKNIKTPIIMLTARDSAEEKTKGFEAGANDYVVKPFVFAELIRRIRALAKKKRA